MKYGKRYIGVVAAATIYFFSVFELIFVPRAYAVAPTGLEKSAIRQAFNWMSPAEVLANGGKARLIGLRFAGMAGVAYLLYESGAINKLISWWNGEPGAWNWQDSSGFTLPNNMHGHVYYASGSYGVARFGGTHIGPWVYPPGTCNGQTPYSSHWPHGSASEAAGYYNSGNPPPPYPPPSVPTDYSNPQNTPGFSAGDLYGTPGIAAAMAALAGGVIPEKVTDSGWLTPSQADALKGQMGLTSISPDGTQAGSNANDNTITSGDTQVVSWLGIIAGILTDIKNYVYNLVGIKTDTGNISNKMDNVASNINLQTQEIQGQSGKLDNIVTAIGINTNAVNQLPGKLDNVVTASNQVKQAADNIAVGVSATNEKLDNVVDALRNSTSDQNSLETRINEIKQLAANKFPFSLAASFVVSAPAGAEEYSFGSLPLTPAISIPINPMNTVFHDFIVWARQLLVYMFWLMTLAAILKKGMEM